MLFQGFKSFTRKPSYWSHADTSWGYALASYFVIGGFLLLFGLSRFKLGKSAFQFTQLEAAGYMEGMAPGLKELPQERSGWRRALTSVLNFI